MLTNSRRDGGTGGASSCNPIPVEVDVSGPSRWTGCYVLRERTIHIPHQNMTQQAILYRSGTGAQSPPDPPRLSGLRQMTAVLFLASSRGRLDHLTRGPTERKRVCSVRYPATLRPEPR